MELPMNNLFTFCSLSSCISDKEFREVLLMDLTFMLPCVGYLISSDCNCRYKLSTLKHPQNSENNPSLNTLQKQSNFAIKRTWLKSTVLACDIHKPFFY